MKNIDPARFADSHHFNADPDPAFHFNADTDPAFLFHADPDQAFHCGTCSSSCL